MFEQSDVFDRIKEVMGFSKEKELADFFDISAQNLSTVKQRGTIPYEKIINKSLNNYNLEYIFFGAGRRKPPALNISGNGHNTNIGNNNSISNGLTDAGIDYDLLMLLRDYGTPKMIEELKTKLIKIKELD
jgi:hypothetical protein